MVKLISSFRISRTQVFNNSPLAFQIFSLAQIKERLGISIGQGTVLYIRNDFGGKGTLVKDGEGLFGCGDSFLNYLSI